MAMLLAHYRIERKRTGQGIRDRVLANPVGLTDEILHALELNRKLMAPVIVLACLASCVNGNSLAEAQPEFEISLIHGGQLRLPI
jgi:hypothetical protein